MTISDLSPDALAQLEAKLVADLEMVRKVRALLEEHRGALWAGTRVPPSAVSQTVPVVPAQPRKSEQERLAEILCSLPGETFRTGDLKWAMHKQGWITQDSMMRVIMNRLLRKGEIAVVTAGVGRGGSTYRRCVSAPLMNDSAPAEAISPPSDAIAPLS